MGCSSFFDEEVSLDNEPRVSCTPQRVEVLDNHSVPEITLDSLRSSDDKLRATFNDWEQFERFVDAVNSLHSRLSGIHK